MSEMIRQATTEADFAAFGRLLSEYVEWMRERYRDDLPFIDRIFGCQSLATELQSLRTAYSEPNGQALLAERDGDVIGAVAFRGLADGSCEMKRLFVPGRFAGHGTGRRLCRSLIASAKLDGYELMRLDTGYRLTEAIAMYESLGFNPCPPYREYPPDVMPYLVFMELSLGSHPADVQLD